MSKSKSPDQPEATTPTPGRLRKIGAGMKKLTRPRQKFQMPNPESGLKVVIATDAWKPQMNGVVTTLSTLGDILEAHGNQVKYITPLDFKSIPLPTYSEIRLSLFPNRKAAKMINAFQPDAIHIATEGPLGRAVRRFCKRRNYPFTTSFHTRFAEYTHERFKFPIKWGYSFLKNFHNSGDTMMVATPGLMAELDERGFERMKLWARGVDTKKFHPVKSDLYKDLKGPIFLYVGRIAVEKSIEDFLGADLPGTKVVVGAGPQEAELRPKYPDVQWLGPKFNEDLVEAYGNADVFVFPSRTDTFGLVNVEALATGVPVAAYPVRGPLEILEGAPAGCGAMDEDLTKACIAALEHRNAQECRAWAERFSWEAGARQFVANLEIPGFDEEFWLRSAQMFEDPFLP
ncbi:MAG: glycosyltransferase family 1 protein [Parvularculaceae bacterium]